MNDAPLGNFSDLANVKASEVTKPSAHPAGHYIGQWAGPMSQHKAAKTGNVAMRFPFKVVAAGDDVDADQLAAKGGLPDKVYYFDFWMSPDARYRFTDFACKSQGLSDDLNLLELAEQLLAENKPFSIENKPQTSEKDPEVSFNQWDNIAAAE